MAMGNRYSDYRKYWRDNNWGVHDQITICVASDRFLEETEEFGELQKDLQTPLFYSKWKESYTDFIY